jgi:diacylglycerol kinase (ATP)
VSAPYFAIVNEAAGSGRCRKLASVALSNLRGRGIDLEIAATEAPKHAAELAQRAAENGRRRFLSVGGDGTASEIVDGLVASGAASACQLAMLPLGTGNSLLRDFAITDIETAANAIERDETKPIDVLRLTHEDGVIHLINTMGTGFVARVGELTNDRFKFLGAAGYIAAVLVCVASLRYEQNTLRYAGTTDDASTVLTSFSNSQYTGGSMRMAPDADVADGLLDVIRAGRLGRVALMAAFARIFAGTHTDLDEVWTRQVDRVEFVETSHQAVLIDGDLFHLTPHSLDVLPAALRLVV